MAGLVQAIHVFVSSEKEDLDARHKAGQQRSADDLHDASRSDKHNCLLLENFDRSTCKDDGVKLAI